MRMIVFQSATLAKVSGSRFQTLNHHDVLFLRHTGL